MSIAIYQKGARGNGDTATRGEMMRETPSDIRLCSDLCAMRLALFSSNDDCFQIFLKIVNARDDRNS